jgi:hypothetical protein
MMSDWDRRDWLTLLLWNAITMPIAVVLLVLRRGWIES